MPKADGGRDCLQTNDISLRETIFAKGEMHDVQMQNAKFQKRIKPVGAIHESTVFRGSIVIDPYTPPFLSICKIQN